MSQIKQEIVIRDFSHVNPASNISLEPAKGKWRVINWKSSSDRGNLLFAYTDPTPDVSIPLNISGIYAISLGLYSPANMKTSLKAKISGDKKFDEFTIVHPFEWIPLERGCCRFEEHFWKIAELNNDELIMSATSSGSGLAFIRLIPLNDGQIDLYRNPEIIEWFCTIDGHGNFIETMEPSTRHIADELEAIEGTDFTTFSWSIIGADVVNYNSNVVDRLDMRKSPIWRQIDIDISDNIARLNEKINPNELAVKAARQNGLKVFISQRPQLWTIEPPLDNMASDFWKNNRDLACRTADGRNLMQMSFAYPEVRNRLYDILCEVAAYKPDGLHLLFNRGIPCTLFEQPVLNAFNKIHGIDMRELDILDPLAVEFRYQYVTAFLKELREKLSDDIDIAVNCFATKELNDKFGLDIKTWAQYGLVQHIMPGRWAWQKDDFDMKFLQEIEAINPDCKFWYYAYNANVWGHNVLSHEHREHALKLIRSGAKRLAGWDANHRQACLNLGHVNEMKIWEQLASPLGQCDVCEIGGVAIDSLANPHFGA